MIRFVKNQDYEGWKKLYLQYGEFYQVPMTHEGLSKVWTWLHDSSQEMEGLVYELSLIHISEPTDKRQSRMPSSA